MLARLVIYVAMPVVALYHTLVSSPFLSVAMDEAWGTEKIGNELLAPLHYLFAGRRGILKGDIASTELRFDYWSGAVGYSAVALSALPVTLPAGCLLKGSAFLFPEVRGRHQRFSADLSSDRVVSHLDEYAAMGLPVLEKVEPLGPPAYQRRPGEENNLSLEKELLSAIATILGEAKIPYWIDCGTCLGAYRYGGVIPWDNDVDLAVLLPDFDNVLRLLQRLDPAKYQVQDWSHRCVPKSYIRVYIKENHNHLDIYHYKIDPVAKTLTYLLSYEVSSLMPESWKIHERRFTVPSHFTTVFPLRHAQFDGIEVNVPHQTEAYLQERYGQNISPIKIYNVATGEYEKDLTHPYWERPYVY